MNIATLNEPSEGQDVVITSISVRSGWREGRKPTTLFSEGTSNVIAAMKRQGFGCLVCISSSGVEHDPALGIVYGKILRPLFFKNMYGGHEPNGARGEKKQPRLDYSAPFRTDQCPGPA